MNFYSGKATIPWRSGRLLTACLLGTGFLAAGVSAQAVPEAPVEDTPAAGQIVSEAPPQIDSAAAAYATKCMGCHTIGGGVLTGPDLKNSASYPRQTVIDAVKRMEKNVGPLSEADVTLFTDFLLAANAAERLAAHREQVQMREAASMAPPDARQGERSSSGRCVFQNGGVSCAACHQAGGRGGNLAASLEDAFTRLGAQPLQATAQNAGLSRHARHL
jgi:mono/diheme cytochrome c family protein